MKPRREEEKRKTCLDEYSKRYLSLLHICVYKYIFHIFLTAIATIKKLSEYPAFCLKSLDHFSVILQIWPQHADKL